MKINKLKIWSAFLPANSYELKASPGFTLMEILVATTVFAFTVVALTSLLNYTLKINRRAEALRQATQGMRNFAEFLVKEIRNGQIDYSVSNGLVKSPIGVCPSPYPRVVGGITVNNVGGAYNNGVPIYGKIGPNYNVDNSLGIITPEGDRECIYYADNTGALVTGLSNGSQIWVKKNTSPAESINPPNFKVNYLAFYVRPLDDPYTNYPSPPPKTQPLVSFEIKFTVALPTGEQVPLYYQTSVSSDKYDIPNQ